MSSYNKIIFLGNMTRDPEQSFLPSQTAVVEFGLAASRKYKAGDGTMKEDTCFVDCKMYGTRCDVITKYCQKGSALLVEGRLQLDTWTAQDGTKRSKHRIFVENFEFVGGGAGKNDSYQDPNTNPPAAHIDPEPAFDDELPF